MRYYRIVSELTTLPFAFLVVMLFYWWFLETAPWNLSRTELLYLVFDSIIFFGVERLLFHGLRIGYQKPVHWFLSFLLALLPSMGLIFLYRWTRILITLFL